MISHFILTSKLQEEKEKLILKQWSDLDIDWKSIVVLKGHRSELKTINEIQKIKEKIVEKLGYVGLFIFLNEYFRRREWSGLY